MSASLQRVLARTPAMTALGSALRPASLRPLTATMTAAPSLSSLRLASTYRNPDDPNADDEDYIATGNGRPPLPQQKYKNKKVWPPDFTRLSPQEQLRFEKRYKRRVALASARPRWVKFIKLVQLFSVTCELRWQGNRCHRVPSLKIQYSHRDILCPIHGVGVRPSTV